MVGIRQFRKLTSNVENDEILCKIEKWNAVSVCIADLAINCQDIAGTAAIDISPFKTDVPKQPEPPFTLTVLLAAITREQDVFNLLASNRRAAEPS